jgi:hypothetical protein
MSKYDALTKHLTARSEPRVTMSFADMERVLGFHLPASARTYRPWWANSGHGHVQARGWLDAGYQSRDVDLASERLTFVKLNAVQAVPGLPGSDHPLWGALAGMITLPPGADLTEPMFTDAEVDEWIDAKASRIAEGMR